MAREAQTRTIVTDQGEITFEVGGDNVFADLGLPNPEEQLAKAELVRAIGIAIHERKLTQRQAAERLEIKQPEVSRLLRGHVVGYSSNRLMHYLTLLSRDIRIIVEPTRDDSAGNVRVLVTG